MNEDILGSRSVDLIFLNQQIANRNEQAVIGDKFDISKWECFK